jgi:antibiotic biosynthesis monooxygenase (ABM) superfamily enzyme
VPARPITVLATRRPLPEREREFDAFLERFHRVITATAGNIGMAVVPPTGSDRDYVVVYR